MKKFVFLFLISIFIVSSLAFSKEPSAEIPNETIETVTVDESTSLEFRFIEEYNELKIIIITPRKTSKTDAEFEEIYQKYVNDWILDENHRYYHYITKSRKHFYSKIKDGKRVNTYEVIILLKK